MKEAKYTGGILGSLITIPPLLFACMLLIQNAPAIVTICILTPVLLSVIKLDQIVSGNEGIIALIVIAGIATSAGGMLLGMPMLEVIGISVVVSSVILSLWTSLHKVGSIAYAEAREDGAGVLKSTLHSVLVNLSSLYGAAKQLITDTYDTINGLIGTVKDSIQVAKIMNA